MKIFTEDHKTVEVSEDEWRGIETVLKEQILFRIKPGWEDDFDQLSTVMTLRRLRGKFKVIGDGLFLDSVYHGNLVEALQWQLRLFDPEDEGDCNKISYIQNIINKLT